MDKHKVDQVNDKRLTRGSTPLYHAIEQGDRDKSSCEKQHSEGGLVKHVERKVGSVAKEAIVLYASNSVAFNLPSHVSPFGAQLERF
jgi:hypothetical protein